MKYRIEETPVIHYMIVNEKGEIIENENGNLFETIEEAYNVINSLTKSPLDQGKHYREYFLNRSGSNAERY